MTDVSSFDGTRLAIKAWGPAEAPIVLLVHGLGMSAESWGRVPELLAGGHRLIAYDLRGHGASGDAQAGGYVMSAHARDLGAVLDAVVPDGGQVFVVAHSLGGGILLAHADAAGTDRIAGAVLAGSGGSAVTAIGLPARRLPPWARACVRAAWLAVLRAGARLGRRIRPVRAVSDRLIRRFAFAPGEPAHLVERVRDNFLGSRPAALAGTTLASVSHDGARLAPALGVPTLVVHGSADPEVSDDDVQELMAGLPDGELVTLPGAGHMLPLTHPEIVVEQVTRWMDRVAYAAPGDDAAAAR
ncbi:alpha/beta fold hydrolase [Modestobacter lapidis]|nr:alpha/beta hydrolase [Modestobacter lapidis]